MSRLLSIAALAFLVTAAPSLAAYQDCSSVASYQKVSDGYGRVPTCWVKKIRSYDEYGNTIVKKVRVCR